MGEVALFSVSGLFFLGTLSGSVLDMIGLVCDRVAERDLPPRDIAVAGFLYYITHLRLEYAIRPRCAEFAELKMDSRHAEINADTDIRRNFATV